MWFCHNVPSYADETWFGDDDKWVLGFSKASKEYNGENSLTEWKVNFSVVCGKSKGKVVPVHAIKAAV
jgi:hypothetical protein